MALGLGVAPGIAFRITPGLMGSGLVFALLMGFLGGLPPAVRAVRMPIVAALRAL
jgi:putative ABC transport system permease protein